MGASDTSLYIPGLRAMGNILSSSEPSVIERCLWSGVVDKLTSLLYQTNSNTVKEALWGFSNITAGPNQHIKKFVDSDAFDRVIMLACSRNLDLRREALFVLCNSVTGADLQVRGQIYEKSKGEILQTLVKGSYINDLKIITNILDAIEELLKLDDWLGYTGTDHSIALLFERYQGLDCLEELQKHPNMEVYNRCSEIMLKYF